MEENLLSLMTVNEVMVYLRLDADDRKPIDRLHTLIRRQDYFQDYDHY
jgi:hypothetical protein